MLPTFHLSLISEYFQSQTQHQVVACVGLGASVVLWFIPTSSNVSKVVSVLGLASSVGYAAGVGATSQKFSEYSDRLESSWNQRLLEQEQADQTQLEQTRSEATAHQNNLETAKTELAEAIAKLKDLHKEAEHWRIQSDVTAAQFKQFKAQSEEAIARAIQVQVAEHDRNHLQKIKAAQSEHRRRERVLVEQYSQLEGQFQSQWQEAAQKYEALLDEYQKVLDSYHPEIREIQATFTQQMASVTEERDRIYTQLAQYHNAKPFTGATKADINGNRLIDFFLNQGVICDADHCESHFEFDEIWLRPRTATVETLSKYASVIQLQFELLKPPEFDIEKGCIKVILRTHTREKTAAIAIIEEQPEHWLEEVAKQSNHYRISAPTDWGKSTLLDNLINCLKLIHGDEFKYDLLDPKYPFTEWTGDIKPSYTKFSGCIQGMELLGRLIDGRISEAEADVKAQRSIQAYPAHLFAIDELEIMVDEARDLDNGAMRGKHSMRLIRSLRKGLKLGRGVTTRKGKGVMVAYITQSPLCSRINLNKDDFDNSTNLFIGDNIPRALAEELNNKLSDKEIAYLTRQYELRRERGDEYIALVKLPKRKTTSSAFIATLPPPGYYALKLQNRVAEAEPDTHKNAKADSEATEANPPSLEIRQNNGSIDSACTSPPTPNGHQQPPIAPLELIPPCPYCHSISIKKNGKRRGKQVFKCCECHRQFTPEE